MNVIRNAVGLLVMFVLIFSLGITFYVLTPIMTGFYTAVNTASPSQGVDITWMSWLNIRTLIIESFYVIVSLVIAFALFSSFWDVQDSRQYLISTVGGLIITPLLIYFITTFWNTFAVMGITFGDISMTFINNFPTILTLNFLFGLAAFVFIKRGKT